MLRPCSAVLAVALLMVLAAPPELRADGSPADAPTVSGILLQETPATADDAPPVDGLGALLTFLAFLFVMLIVPWVMAGSRADQARASETPEPVGGAGSLFASDRERRLWLWALAVIVAIYATLSPAQQLAMALRERNLLRLTSGAFLGALGVVLALYWIRTRPGRREVGAGLGVAAAYLTTVIRLPVPEARSHLFEYGLVAMLVYFALVERRRSGRRVPLPALLAVVVTALLGWLDEGIQWLLPNRVYDLVDVGFNALAATMAVTAAVFMGWARRLDVFHRRTT